MLSAAAASARFLQWEFILSLTQQWGNSLLQNLENALNVSLG